MTPGSPASQDLPEDPHEAAVQLLHRVAHQADRQAFSELYERFAGATFATILTIVRDHADAEDTLQECFCALWDHADQYDPARGKAVSWIMTIARNKAFDHLAKAKRRGRIASRILEEKGAGHRDDHSIREDGFCATALQEEARAVAAALRELPCDQRQAIQLAFLNGMTQSEVARSLDQPIGTVKARIRRGLYQLRGTLQPYLAGPAS